VISDGVVDRDDALVASASGKIRDEAKACS
jgi:hypothetical protein